MKLFRNIVFSVLLPTLTACGTMVQYANRSPDNGLRPGDSYRLAIQDDSGSLPQGPTFFGALNVAWTSKDARREQTKFAAEQLANRLKNAGFTVVSLESESQTILTLELQSIRWDPFGGWITDGAGATVTSGPNKFELCRVAVGGSFITASLTEVIDKLSDAILATCIVSARPQL